MLRKYAFQVNVWIADTDFLAFPLAFADSSTINVSDIHPSLPHSDAKTLEFNDGQRYVYVPNMKKGEMLLFKGSEVFSGYVSLVQNQGVRKTLTLFFYYDKINGDGVEDEVIGADDDTAVKENIVVKEDEGKKEGSNSDANLLVLSFGLGALAFLLL
jgi:hypothetical protein